MATSDIESVKKDLTFSEQGFYVFPSIVLLLVPVPVLVPFRLVWIYKINTVRQYLQPLNFANFHFESKFVRDKKLIAAFYGMRISSYNRYLPLFHVTEYGVNVYAYVTNEVFTL